MAQPDENSLTDPFAIGESEFRHTAFGISARFSYAQMIEHTVLDYFLQAVNIGKLYHGNYELLKGGERSCPEGTWKLKTIFHEGTKSLAVRYWEKATDPHTRLYLNELSVRPDGRGARLEFRREGIRGGYFGPPAWFLYFVRKFVYAHGQEGSLLDGELPILHRARLLTTVEDLYRLRGAILSGNRLIPILVVAQALPATAYEPWTFPKKLARPDQPYSAERLAQLIARHSIGVRHVYHLPMKLNADWRDMVGEACAVRFGGFREYHTTGELLSPPKRNLKYYVSLPELKRSEAWHRAGRPLATASMRLPWMGTAAGHSSPFEEVEALIRREAAIESKSIEMLQQVADEEKADADRKIKSLEESLRAREEELEAAREECRSQRARADAAEHALRKKTNSLETWETDPLPEDWDEIPGWAERTLPDKLVLHSRAVRSLKSACYEDMLLVIRALVALATEYRAVKLGEVKAEEWERKLEELGIKCGGSISEGRAGGNAYDDYHVDWDGRKVFVESSLKRGTGRDPRYCLRIYFFWDSKKNIVVVVSLPAHLDNRFS